MPFIASIILLQVALIVAAVDEGFLILARSLRSLLDISANSLLLGADLGFVRLACHLRAKLRECKVYLRQCLLGIIGYLQFDARPRRCLGRTKLFAAAQDRRHEALRRCPGHLKQELCLSLRPSSFLPSSLWRWAEAASF